MATKYTYLENLKNPRIVFEGLKLLGTKEIIGKQHNPIILGWGKELGVEKVYTSDEIAWCGLFVGVVITKAGFEIVKDPLWARNWLNYGRKQNEAGLGDVLVFSRTGGGGHVGFYIGEDTTCYHVLGGNQNNVVSITRILKSRCIGVRRTIWKVSQPEMVKKYVVSSTGIISTNEA